MNKSAYDYVMKSFHEKLRELRLKAGLTQTQAAELVGITLRGWQYWESGERKMPAVAWELFCLKAKKVIEKNE